MTVRVMAGTIEAGWRYTAVLYDDDTMRAFGPVIQADDPVNAHALLTDFLAALRRRSLDPLRLAPTALDEALAAFRDGRDFQRAEGLSPPPGVARYGPGYGTGVVR